MVPIIFCASFGCLTNSDNLGWTQLRGAMLPLIWVQVL